LRKSECRQRQAFQESSPVHASGARLLLGADVVRGVPVLADELDEFRIRHDPLVHFNFPGLGIRFRIVNRDLDLKGSIVGPAKALGHFRLIAERASSYIKPLVVGETGSFDYQSVAFPATDRISIPPRLRIFPRKLPPIGEYLAQAAVRLINDQ